MYIPYPYASKKDTVYLLVYHFFHNLHYKFKNLVLRS